MLTGSVTHNFQNSRYFRCPVWKTKNWYKSKPTRKLKHANSILEYFEYFCQMSSKSIFIVLSYTVSKLVRFFETQCTCSDYVGAYVCVQVFAEVRSVFDAIQQWSHLYCFYYNTLYCNYSHWYTMTKQLGYLLTSHGVYTLQLQAGPKHRLRQSYCLFLSLFVLYVCNN